MFKETAWNFSYLRYNKVCIKVCNVCYFVMLSFDSSRGGKIFRILCCVTNLIVYRIINLFLTKNETCVFLRKRKRKNDVIY